MRLRKPFIWLLLLTLVASVIPTGLSRVAEAAVLKPTSYFTPDIAELRNTVDLLTTPSAPDETNNVISRSNVYQVTNAQLLVTGTYSKVTGSTLGVNIQHLNQTGQSWVDDSTQVAPGVIQLDTDSPDNRFKANVTLFPGMNRITFNGTQGLNTRYESFYVLYDKVPYIDKLVILGAGDQLNLNEGAQVVVPKDKITLTGSAQNASKITISINGGSDLATTLLDEGTFYSQQLQLKPGVNNLKLVAQNGSDSLTFNYSLFYYDEKNPIVGMYLSDKDGNAQSLLGNSEPVYTEKPADAKLYVQVLVPDSGQTFSGNAAVKMDDTILTPAYYESMNFNNGKISTVAGSEVFIPGINQNSQSYRLVTFALSGIPFLGTAGSEERDQNHNLSITYGTKTINKTADFQYMPGQTLITSLKYLNGYDESMTTVPAGESLDGAKLNGSDFYILVDTNSTPAAGAKLTAKYLPLATENITLKLIKNVTDTEYIYQVSGFKNGNQTVRFQYDSSTAYKDVTISFASKNYIYVANLSDGQTYTIKSSDSHKLPVTGQYVDFDTLDSEHFLAEVTVNGIKVQSTSTTAGLDPDWLDTTTGEFDFSLDIDVDKGPLVFGENKIILTGTATDTAGASRVISKSLRIYIVDENVSNITNFQPAVGNNRPDFPPRNFTSDNPQLPKIFNLTPDFIYADGKYTTSLKTYDLVLRGNGAVRMDLNLGTSNILTVNIPATSNDGDKEQVIFKGKVYNYEFAGNQKDFIMRIHDFLSEDPGSYVYNLELINGTGAKTTRKIEIAREVSSYRLLSPQPTVGDQYVVNKNFVHFDIEAEGATSVMIDKEEAVKRTDLGDNRFVLDYVGLKQDKATPIKITINRNGTTFTSTISVYYTGAVGTYSEYMAPKVAAKYTIFNKKLELSFPKGTLLQSTDSKGLVKYYPDTKLRFGIADPATGIVEKRNDYGNIIGFPGSGVDSGQPTWTISDEYYLLFSSTNKTENFTRISDIYWVNGGLGEYSTQGSADYIPATNGLSPYSVDGIFGDPETPSERIVTPSQRGSLTISYNSNVVDEAGTQVTVFEYTKDRVWRNVGGEVDTKSHTITVPFDEFGYYMVAKMSRGYTDITNHSWARNILNAMYAKGLMNNLRFEQFGTDDQTSRGEFATLLVKGLNLPLVYDDNNTFVDILPGSASTTWDYEHIETAARAGIVTGQSEGVFDALGPITREQAAVMIARALKLKLALNDSKLQASVAKQFLDSGRMSIYALPSIDAVYKAKIMSGSPVTIPGQSKPSYNFNPTSKMTRAEAAKIAVELLKKSTSIFPKNLS